MKRRRLLVNGALIALVAAIMVATQSTVAHGDTIEPTLIGPTELTVGEFVLIVVCVAVLVAFGIYALARIRRRRRRGAMDEAAPSSEDRRQ
jgi:heme/copper-type cytochrome/quinol oxidase subunit 2